MLSLFLACLLTSCSSPFGPSNNEGDLFTWTVDGAQYKADKSGISASNSTSGKVTLKGFSCLSGLGLSLEWSGLAPGTYTSQEFEASWTPDGKTYWDMSSTLGTGSLTITTSAATKVTGRFSLQMVPRVGNSTAGNRSVAGSFDISFDRRVIC